MTSNTPDADRLATLSDAELIQEAIDNPPMQIIDYAIAYGTARGFLGATMHRLGPLANNGNDAHWIRHEVGLVLEDLRKMLEELPSPGA